MNTLVNNRKALPHIWGGGGGGGKEGWCVEGRRVVCVEGRQCVQEGWQGEEPYFESDKSNVHSTRNLGSCKSNK